jgi:predicted dehydrogenase
MAIRVAAIGVGHWHSLFDAAYLKTLVGMDEATLVGIADPDPEIVLRRAEQLGRPPAFSDYRDMLAQTRPDFVIVLGRHDAMAPAAQHLLDEGYPCMIEKPVGLDAEQVRRLRDQAAAKRAFVAVPLFQRLHPFVAHAQRLLAEGAFGPLSRFSFRSIRPTSARYAAWGSPWMLDPAVAGGGCLRNIGIHGIDLFLTLTGEDVEVTAAQLSARALGERVEDYALVLLRSASGVLGVIEVGTTHPGKGADGEWQLAGRDALLVQRGGRIRCTTAAAETELAAAQSEPLSAVALKDILARWRAGEPPLTGLEDCYRVMQLIDRAYAIATPAASPSR